MDYNYDDTTEDDEWDFEAAEAEPNVVSATICDDGSIVMNGYILDASHGSLYAPFSGNWLPTSSQLDSFAFTPVATRYVEKNTSGWWDQWYSYDYYSGSEAIASRSGKVLRKKIYYEEEWFYPVPEGETNKGTYSEIVLLPSGHELPEYKVTRDGETIFEESGTPYALEAVTRSGYSLLSTTNGPLPEFHLFIGNQPQLVSSATLGLIETPNREPAINTVESGSEVSKILVNGTWMPTKNPLPYTLNARGEGLWREYPGHRHIWRNGRLSLIQDLASYDGEIWIEDLNDRGTLLARGEYFNESQQFVEEPLLLLPYEFVTKGANNTLKPVDGFFNGTAAPVIEANAGSCSISSQGVVTLSVSGTVTDATSDLIDTPSKQLQSLFVRKPGGQSTLSLNNSASPELPWKPYKFSSSFSTTVTFSTSGPGEYPVELKTSENAGGMAASTQAYVHVFDLIDNIEMTASLDPGSADVIRYYTGPASSGDPGELMTETANTSKRFAFDPDTFVQVEILSSGALTSSIDSLSVRLHYGSQHRDIELTETGAESNHFVHSECVASCSKFPPTAPGTFLPIAVRFPVVAMLQAGDVRIETMGRMWKLAVKNFGDGEYLYIVDDQGKAVVFNPSAYAQTHIQTKPLDLTWAFNVLKSNDELGAITLERLDGLLVAGASIRNYLGDSLIAGTYVEKTIKLGSTTYYNYCPSIDGNGNPLPVQVTGNPGTALKQEILWRYVTAENKVVIFNSFKDLERDITYRKNVVATAQNAQFAYIGDGAGQQPVKMNPAYWVLRKDSLPGLDILTELKNNTSPIRSYAALQDVFTNPNNSLEYNLSVYAVACQGGARLVTRWAIAQTLGAQQFEGHVQGLPLARGDDFVETRYVSSSEEDKAFWIPGDWGFIENKDHDPNDAGQVGRDGENVIYLGGCYQTDPMAFLNQAPFWGHGFGIKTLQQMIDGISGWGTIEVHKIRRDLNHDVFHQQ